MSLQTGRLTHRFANEFAAFVLALLAWALNTGCHSPGHTSRLEFIRVSQNEEGFVLHPSGNRFQPWGFNYDHDESGRLLEDYWDAEWPKVEEDFREMKALGANVVRVHLQFGKFMEGPTNANSAAVARFQKLLVLAGRTGLHLDVTGLGCYHKADVPDWYDRLDEEQRWSAQAAFWRAIAIAARKSPAIFCFDLMNEPVAPHRDGRTSEWLGPPFAGKHFVQWISRSGNGRDRTEIARAWTRRMVRAIREVDPDRLITVGLVDWSLPRPGLDSGFHPEVIAPELDFLSVHLYPEAGRLDQAIDTLKAFAVGKPIVIEETFPLRCGIDEFSRFHQRAKQHAAGWLGFYWGRTPDECRRSSALADALMLQWLEWFQQHRPLTPAE